MKISKTQAIKKILSETFPEYTGRKFFADYSGRVTFIDTNWGGGTRNSYKAVNLENGKVQPLPVSAPWANPVEGHSVEIPAGCAVVEHSIFCGQDSGITLHMAENSVGLLPMLLS